MLEVSPRMWTWFSFCACAGCELIAGQVYGFGLFSDLLRNTNGLGLSQASVEAVAVSENLGQYVRLAGGMTYDRWGAKVTMRIGFVLNSIGYLAILFAIRAAAGSGDNLDDGWKAPTSVVCASAALYGQGAGWIETAVIATTVANFPDEAAGLLKTFFGVASAVGAVAFAALFAPSRESLLLALGLSPLVLGFPLSVLVVPGGADAKAGTSASAPWQPAYAVAFALVLALAAHSGLTSMTTWLRPYEEHRLRNIAALGVVLGLLAALPALPLYFARSGGKAAEKKPAPRVVDDCTFVEALRRANFWFLFLALAAGEGAGLMVLNNMGQLVKALDNGDSSLQPGCVSAFSVSNAVGRLCMGQLAAGGALRRTQLLCGALAAAAVAYACFSFGTGRVALLAAMPFMGFGYGCMWSLQPLLASELFGKRAYGSKYAALSLAAVAGSTPLCQLVVPAFYEAHADKDGWCVGPECFSDSLRCASLVCTLGAVLALLLDSSVLHGAGWKRVGSESSGSDESPGVLPNAAPEVIGRVGSREFVA